MEDRKQIKNEMPNSIVRKNSEISYRTRNNEGKHDDNIPRAKKKKNGSSSLGVAVEIKRKRSGSGYAWAQKEMDVLKKYVAIAGTNLLTEDLIQAISKELVLLQIGTHRTTSAIKTRFQSVRSKMGYSLLPNKSTNRPWTEKEKNIIRKYCNTRNWAGAYMELSAEGFERKKSSVSNGGTRLIEGTWRPVTVEESNDIREMHGIYPCQWTKISNITGIPKGKCRHHINRLALPGNLPPIPPAPWTPDEDSQLLANVAVHSSDWDQVKDDLIGRSVAACQRRFEKLTRYLWDEESSKDLVEYTRKMLVEQNGQVDWDEIAKSYEHRNAVMCELRYRLLADPTFT